MPDERQFLAAIDAEPENRAARLVYADWLEDRGDARGELIHAEEEMRAIAIHSDRYWELKARRRELRRSAKPAWLKRMNYGGTDYEPVFGDVPDGWKERWRLLREFTERWHELPMGDVGGPIEAARKRKGAIAPSLLAALPPSLREWRAFIRDLEQAVGSRGVRDFGPGANDSHEWSEFEGRIYFLNFDGNREDFSVHREHLQQPDPPVEYTSIYDEAGCSFPHVTTFAFQYLMSTWADQKAEAKFAVRATRNRKLGRQLAKAFPVRSVWDGIGVFERTNMVAILNQNAVFTGDELDLQVMVRAPASLEDVPAFIGEMPAGRSLGFEDP